MQPNKKYVASDGHQYAMYPTQFMNITQSINGSYSHKGTNAIDDAQQNTGIQNGYAPCDMRCVATDYKNGNAMFWQSVNPVHTVKYGLTHIYMMVIHDNTANAYVGMTISQGTQLFSEGTAGMATGNHSHIEVGIGNFKGMYVLNGYGVYMMPGNVRPDDVFFVNDTQIINGGGLNWRNTSVANSSSYDPKQLINEHAYATLKFDIQKRRDTPTGMVVETLKTGRKLEYTQKWAGNGHRYISWVEHQVDGHSYRYFVAVNGNEQGTEPWATFSPIEESKPQKPTTPTFDIKQLIQEDGIATLTVDKVNARRDSPTGSVVRQYGNGNEIRYFWKWIGNGHRYIVWKEGDVYIFLAISNSEKQGVEPWATFRAVDEKPTKPQDTKPEPPKKEFPNSVKFKGVDISEHNGDFDVKGNDFIIIRATYGTNMDKHFLNNVKKCKDNNVPFGLYVYDYALDDEQAKEQAKYIVDLMKKNDIIPQLGVWFDMEDADTYKQRHNVLTKDRCTKSCKIFCDYLKERGYYTGIYSSSSWFGNYIDELGYPKWIANWGSNDGTCQGDFSKEAVMHQYCANPLDRDVMYVDMEVMKSTPKEVTPMTPLEPSTPIEKPSKPNNDDRDSLINNLIKALTKLIRTITKWFNKKD